MKKLTKFFDKDQQNSILQLERSTKQLYYSENAHWVAIVVPVQGQQLSQIVLYCVS